MVTFVFICIISWSFLVAGVTQADQVLDEGELVYIHVLFRHGDRTPIDPYPTDPYKDPSNWPTGFGQLTNAGKKRHYELGKWLRQRYAGVLNDTYSREDIFVRSTDVDRTLMSASANLAGLFPPVGKDIWNTDLLWQPIPIHTEHEKHDKILAMKKSCAAYDSELERVKHSDDFRTFNAKYKSVYQYLTENSGRKVNDVSGAAYIYGCLSIEEKNNKTLPEWTKSVYPEPLKFISARSFQTSTYTRPLARLKAGPLIKEILERCQSKINGTLKHKRIMTIYSAHDTTVSSTLNTLKLFDPPHSPPFAACIMFELRVFKNEHYLTIVYKNDTNPQIMSIPGCGVSCPLSKMFELYDDVLPSDWDAECRENAAIFEALIGRVGSDLSPAILIICLSVSITSLCLVFYTIYRKGFIKKRSVYRQIY